MKNFNWFCGFGRAFLFIALFYAYQLYRAYGGGIPANVGQWIGECLAGFFFVSGAAFYATGKYLERKG